MRLSLLTEFFDDDYQRFEQAGDGPPLDDAARLIARLLAIEPPADVLDAPCGHGRIASRLAQLGYRVTGVDANSRFLSAAGADAEHRGLAVSYREGDLRDSRWREDFDGSSAGARRSATSTKLATVRCSKASHGRRGRGAGS